MLEAAFFYDKKGYGRYFEHRLKTLASERGINPKDAMQIVLTGMILKPSELEAFCKSHLLFIPLIISAREELQNSEKRGQLIYAIKEIIKPYSDWPASCHEKSFTVEQYLKGTSEIQRFGLDFCCGAPMVHLPIHFFCGNSDYNPLNSSNEVTHVDIDYDKDVPGLKLNFHLLKLMQLFYPNKLKSMHFNTYGSSLSELKDVVELFDAPLLANTSVKIVANEISKQAEFNLWEMVPTIEITLNSKMSFENKQDWYCRLLQNTKQLKVSFESDSLHEWIEWHKEELFGLLNKRTSFTLVIAGKYPSIDFIQQISEGMNNTSIILDVKKPSKLFNEELQKEFGDRLTISETGVISVLTQSIPPIAAP